MKTKSLIVIISFILVEWIVASVPHDVSFVKDVGCGLRWHSAKVYPEWVRGCGRKALRTDGYSTYLEGNLKPDIKSVCTWFALESYPTDTAACIALLDEQNKVSFSLCVDRFGTFMSVVYDFKENRKKVCSLNKKINCFEWFNVETLLGEKVLSCFFDGKYLADITLPERTLRGTGKWKLRLGRDFIQKKAGIYDVTCLNGLISYPQLTSSFEVKDVYREVMTYKACKPSLMIPDVRFKDDFHRPTYHLLPAANWTNETHGLFYYQGKYHIFNQKNASSIFLGQINWGHFSSPDLLHWTEEKPALTPNCADDKNGIWSGCAVINDKGVPQLFYTSGGDKNGIGVAFPVDEELIEWKKYKGNPVIYGQPESMVRGDLRDPFVWKDGDVWYMAVGYGIEGDRTPRGALLLYKSSDALKWEYVHLLFEGNPEIDHSGVFWEMPFFLKMGGKYILQVNRVPHNGVPARSQYWIGDFKGEKFVPDNPVPQNLEVINRLLSPSVLKMDDSTVVAMAIIPDEISAEVNYKHGWAHVYSIPRIWKFKNGKICQSAHPIIQQLRKNHLTYPRKKLEQKSPFLISKGIHHLEAKIVFYPKDARQFGITLCKNPEGSEYSMIYYDREKQELVVDQTHSSLLNGIPLEQRKECYRVCGDSVTVHLFIDGSVIEGFVNNEDAFTTRIFPQKENSTLVELFSDGEFTEVSADVWELDDAKVEMNF